MNYDEFIQSIRESRENKWFEYSERHHIVPRCVGGTDDEENLIYLTYREHFIAHKLLAEEHPDNEDLVRAINLMSDLGRYECTPEEYDEAKRRFSDSQRGNKHFEGKTHTEEWKVRCSDWMKNNKNALGKIWIHNISGDTLMIDPQYLPVYESAGWIQGRGNFHTEETKEYCKRVSENRIWITNGIISKMIYSSEGIPEGWRRGRLIKQDSKGRIVKSNG